jgi:hypothetical protein
MHGMGRAQIRGGPSGTLAGDRQTAQSESEHAGGTRKLSGIGRQIHVYLRGRWRYVLELRKCHQEGEDRAIPVHGDLDRFARLMDSDDHANVLAAIEWNVRN